MMPKVHMLDYAAGNIRSLVNAIEKVGWEVEWITSPDQIAQAEVSNPFPKNPIHPTYHRLIFD